MKAERAAESCTRDCRRTEFAPSFLAFSSSPVPPAPLKHDEWRQSVHLASVPVTSMIRIVLLASHKVVSAPVHLRKQRSQEGIPQAGQLDSALDIIRRSIHKQLPSSSAFLGDTDVHLTRKLSLL